VADVLIRTLVGVMITWSNEGHMEELID